MPGGAFTPGVRAAVVASHPGCVGCGARATEVHHRAPRGAGGTSNRAVGAPFNGLPLCGFHHRWAESHRAHAALLGWLTPAPPPDAPFWTSAFGWCRWVLLTDGPPCWCVQPFQPSPGPPHDDAARAFQAKEKPR